MANCCENTLDAAGKAHIDCIKDLRDAGHPWHPDTTAAIFLHEMGCPWHCYTTYIGNEDIFRLLHEFGCPWHPKTIWLAAAYGNINIVKYIYENCGDEISWEKPARDK